jgi:hypothetical protein
MTNIATPSMSVNASPTSGTVCAKDLSTTSERSPGRVSPADNLSLTPATTAQNITTHTTLVLGEGGIPGRAYIVASDLGPSAMCVLDYCDRQNFGRELQFRSQLLQPLSRNSLKVDSAFSVPTFLS